MRTLTLSFSLLAAAAAIASDDDDVKRSPSVEQNAARLNSQIQTELKTLPDHEWAAEYYAGDGLGVNTTLSLAPKTGFVFEWHGCMGLYDRNYGSVTWTNDRVHLSFQFKNDREGFQGLAGDLVPVPWGKRRYLVPADDVVGFCNRVNDGSEPRADMHGDYLLRQGDETNLVTGFPTVPKHFQAFLLPKPVEAQIVSVDGSGALHGGIGLDDVTWVTLNAGADQGLRVGMELLVIAPTNTMESVKIAGVQAKTSEGTISRVVKDEPEPQPGWKLSTHAPWNSQPTLR